MRCKNLIRSRAPVLLLLNGCGSPKFLGLKGQWSLVQHSWAKSQYPRRLSSYTQEPTEVGAFDSTPLLTSPLFRRATGAHPISLSAATAAKLGHPASGLVATSPSLRQVHSVRNAAWIQKVGLPVLRYVVGEFDRACQASSQIGLYALADAARNISRTLSFSPLELITIRSLQSDTPYGKWYWRVRHLERKTEVFLTLLRPWVFEHGKFTVSKEAGHTCSIDIKFAALDTRSIAEVSVSSHVDVHFLYQSILAVESKLSADLTFPTQTAAASTLAETLLRVARFRTPQLQIKRVSALWRDVQDQHSSILARAFWSSGDESTASSEVYAEGDIVVVDCVPSPIVPRTVQTTADLTPLGHEEPCDTTVLDDNPAAQTEPLATVGGRLGSASDLSPEATSPGSDYSAMNVREVGGTKTVFIALGSNVGDRIQAIEAACRSINGDPDMQIVDTSLLYETQPMYVEDQDPFLNGVCEVITSLPPMELLDRLQAIENKLGRVKTVDKGPRNIDLDILAYGSECLQTERLTIPHALMLEREFVLRPLCDMRRGRDFRHPGTGKVAALHLSDLTLTARLFTPLAPKSVAVRPGQSHGNTLIMSILNVTPDSFSDGGSHHPTDLATIKSTALKHITAGASIIDVGGQSSRPNAPDITADEELSRILPAIEVIKSLPEAEKIAISVDTYRASVAEAAVDAGAHIVNDVSGGTLDENMLSTIARLGCTYILTHMRGTPATMQDPDLTSYPNGVVLGVSTELMRRTHLAVNAGIFRWRIILDPGIGFAKTADQNLKLLAHSHALRKFNALNGFPWLIGSSRKGFVGSITGVQEPRERVMGTAATVTAAIQGGADIVRVHDVKEMAEVVKMADALYKHPIKA